MTETHATNAHEAQTHVQLIQTTNLASAQATQSCTMMKISIKQYETHTNNKITWGNIPMTILPGLLLDLSSQGKFDRTHQCRTSQFNFYVGGTYPSSPSFPKGRNRIV